MWCLSTVNNVAVCITYEITWWVWLHLQENGSATIRPTSLMTTLSKYKPVQCMLVYVTTMICLTSFHFFNDRLNNQISLSVFLCLPLPPVTSRWM